MARNALIDLLQPLVPALESSLYKGQCGKIAVIGGCLEYTGAPYYAAYSALRIGADLSHVFCEEEAGIPIKSYCPDLIVHPVIRPFSHRESTHRVQDWFPRLNALVIGPGLGRNQQSLSIVSDLIKSARESSMPIVIDGDGLFLISQKPELIAGYHKAILTPNKAEFARLQNYQDETIEDMCRRLGNVTIIQKGVTDVISDGRVSLVCDTEGGRRRCGGQGDILSGSIGTIVSWSYQTLRNQDLRGAICAHLGWEAHAETASLENLCAGYVACHILRCSAKRAFGKHKRSTLTPDIISELGGVIDDLFPLSPS